MSLVFTGLIFPCQASVSFPFNALSGNDADTVFRIHDDVYHNNIRTVRLHRKGYEMSFPVINYNTGEKLHLSFDDLDGDIKVYKYKHNKNV